jgi:prepilin-type N-terminal cleavage/methylation domain-containing protein
MKLRTASRGFTIPEVLIALGLLGVSATLLAQVGLWALQERNQNRERQAIQERVVNLLEQARAMPWQELTPDWASKQTLSSAERDRGWKLDVRVADEPGRLGVKRLTVTMTWKAYGNQPRKEELTALLARRSRATPGGKP